MIPANYRTTYIKMKPEQEESVPAAGHTSFTAGGGADPNSLFALFIHDQEQIYKTNEVNLSFSLSLSIYIYIEKKREREREEENRGRYEMEGEIHNHTPDDTNNSERLQPLKGCVPKT
jgi:hypothetical protein